MNIKEELSAVSKWLMSADVRNKCQKENISTILVMNNGNGCVSVTGSATAEDIFILSRAFITSMLEDLDDKALQSRYRIMITDLINDAFLDELYGKNGKPFIDY